MDQLPSGHDSDPAAAAQVDYARHHPGHHALHALLCSAVSRRSDAFDHHEGVGAVAGIAAPDLWIRHFPLPADGRGSDLQARHGVHAGRSGHRGSVLRSSGRDCGTSACARAEFRTLWLGGGRRGHRAVVRSGAEVDSGKARPVFLPDPLRLPAHADRVWTGIEFGDRPRQNAFLAGRPAGTHAAGGSHRDLSRQQRLFAL